MILVHYLCVYIIYLIFWAHTKYPTWPGTFIISNVKRFIVYVIYIICN